MRCAVPSPALTSRPVCAVQVYDVAPVALGGLSTSLAVPPLLAAFYAVLGALFIACDDLGGGPPRRE